MTETINVNSGSKDRTERVLSNLNGEFPFIIHGRTYASVEIPLQMIKFPPGSEIRETILNLSGKDAGINAKRLGRKAKGNYIYWDGRVIKYNSIEHTELLESFIQAKFSQNKEAMKKLLSTEGRVLDHDLGHPESQNTSLPKNTFLLILTRIRRGVMGNLNAIKRGEAIGSTLNACSVCADPTLFGTCGRCFKIATSGFHPEEGIEICSIAVCSQIPKENCLFGFSRKVTGGKIEKKEKEHPFAIWDRGEHVYSDCENTLMALRINETLGNVLSSCTICPVGNMTCNEFFTINVEVIGSGIHEIMVCPLSVKRGDDCPFSK